MRAWISIAECRCATVTWLGGFARVLPLRRRPRARTIGLGLNAAIFGCLFRLRRRAEVFVIERRRSCFALSRRDDDRRMPPFRFECLAKIVRLRI